MRYLIIAYVLIINVSKILRKALLKARPDERIGALIFTVHNCGSFIMDKI